MYKNFNKSGLFIATGVGTALLMLALATSSVDLALRGAYVLLILSALSAIGLPLYFAIQNPKSLAKAGISVGIVGALFLGVYASSSSEILPQYIALGVSEGQVQFSGAIITMMIIMVALALTSILVTEVYNLIRK